MKVDYFGAQSDAIPVLVNIFDGQELYELAKDKTPQAREDLVTKIISLLDVPLSMREKELAADILIDLMRQAERDLRCAVSERLATMDDVPLRLILSVANDDIEVAAPLLENSPILNDLDLIYIIKGKSEEYWRTIAKRKHIGDDIVNMLAETKDLGTALNLTKNENITLKGSALTIIADMARGHDNLAAPLLRRNEVTADMAKALYDYVGESLKKHISKTFKHQPGDISKAMATMDEVTGELRVSALDKDEHDQDAMIPGASHIRAAKASQDKKLLNANLMIDTLKRKQTALFTAQFCVMCKLPVKRALKILSQTNGQKLAIVCKAYDISQMDFIALFTLSAHIRGQNEAVQTEDIQKATEHYKMISKSAATQLIKSL